MDGSFIPYLSCGSSLHNPDSSLEFPFSGNDFSIQAAEHLTWESVWIFFFLTHQPPYPPAQSMSPTSAYSEVYLRSAPCSLSLSTPATLHEHRPLSLPLCDYSNLPFSLLFFLDLLHSSCSHKRVDLSVFNSDFTLPLLKTL